MPVPTKMEGAMPDQEQSEVSPKVKQKVAQEVEVKTTASEKSENPVEPISESDVPTTGDARCPC